MSDRYVSLHRHTSFSLYDGLDITMRGAHFAAKLEQPALALTDHGNVYGLVEHHRWCVEAGVKPIMGCEVYVVDTLEKESHRHHLTVLARNAQGYQNLMRLVTMSYPQMYYKPRITWENLFERRDGLIVLSGCPSGHIGWAIREGDLARAERYFVMLLDAFGRDFYAEVQHNDRAQVTVPYLHALAEKHGVEMVFTNDAHYVEAQDRVAHDLLLRIKAGDKGEQDPTYGAGFHMPTRQEAFDLVMGAHPTLLSPRDARRMLDMTVEIADKVDPSLPKPERLLPKLFGEAGEARQMLRAKVDEGMHRLGKLDAPAYIDRLSEETRVIEKLGYEEYFLVVEDVVSNARSRGILVGPRGSVCGSLLAYVLGITTIDPLVHGTLFERFLHDQKKSPPDVDLDFDARYKDDVRNYVLQRFAPFAVPIVTYGRWGAGNVSSDLQKGYDVSPVEGKQIRRALDELKEERVFTVSEERLGEFPVFAGLERRHPGLIRATSRLYSQVRYVGRHPGGVCFVPSDHTQWFAKGLVADKLEVTTANFIDLEYLGLMKYDFLGLTAVQVISKTMELVRERTGVEIDLAEVDLADGPALARFAAGDTDGVFQFETRGAREILRDIKPGTFAEVAAATALNRPGVMDNLPLYVEGKKRGGEDHE